MRRVASVAALALVAGSVAYATACSLQTGGGLILDTDGGPHDDASSGDASDAGAGVDACPTATCNGACVATCDGCDAGPALCTRTRACGQCDKCPGYELECFACADGGGAAVAFCAMPPQCGVPAENRCACPFGEPMQCPGKNQICLGTMQQAWCFSCGENGTLNFSCSNGLICVDDPMPPACTGS
jgi:hypothetical protein